MSILQGFKTNKQDKLYENERCIRTEDGNIFRVDADILSRNCYYFKNLFQYDSSREILIRVIPGDAMKIVISFIQGKAVELNCDNIVNVLKAADFMILNYFSQKITSVLPFMIYEGNCIHLYNAALYLEHLEIFNISRLYLQIHFQSIVCISNIEDLAFDNFQQLLFDDELSLKNEGIIWEAIVKWVSADKKSRYEAVPVLLRCIRLDACDDSLIQKMMDHPVIQENEYCNGILQGGRLGTIKIVCYQKNFINRIKNMSLEPTAWGPRHQTGILCRIVYTRSQSHWGDFEMSVIMSDDKNRTIFLADKSDFLPKFVSCCSHVVYTSDVNGNLHTFDLLTKSWLLLPLPLENFKTISYVVVDGRLFATMIKCIPSPNVFAAIYDPLCNDWRLLASYSLTLLSAQVCCMESAVRDRLIYVVATGYFDESEFTSHRLMTSFACVYDSDRNVWSSFKLPNAYFASDNLSFTLVSFRNNLYFIWSEQNSVFRYFPNEETWDEYSILPFKYELPRAVVHDDTLIVYGTSEGRCPLYWDLKEFQWCYLKENSSVTLKIVDEDVLWKYRHEFRKRDWFEAVKQWKRGKR